MHHSQLLLVACLLCASTASAADLLPPDRPIPEAIDHYIDAALQKYNSVASSRANDGVVLRRTTLDLVGRIPTAAEARAYGSSVEQDKRRKMVERLLADEGFVRHQANAFDAMLMYGSGGDLKDYLRTAIRENRPWKQLFEQLIVGDPADEKQEGAIQYIRRRAKDIDQLTVKASVDFFGVNISCAKCHDHPEAEWTQDRFYGMKSFFARTFENGGFVGERDYGLVTFKTTAGESRDAKLMFLTGEVVEEPEHKSPDDKQKKEEKKLLDKLKKEKKAPPAPKFSRRQQLVEAAFSEQGELYFSRAIVNHVWARLMGRGIVSPVDQMHPENPPSHPQLLDWLARDVRENGYDLRRLIQGIVLSEAYARSSVWDSESERPDDDLFAVGAVRPLTPWQYANSLRLAASSPELFAESVSNEELVKRLEKLEDSARGFASQIEMPGEDFQVGVSEALLFSNGERFRRDHLGDGKTLVGALSKMEDDKELIDTLFWSAFGRAASQDEAEAVTKYLAARSDRRQEACRQLVWALLTSSEMRFNY